jgi:hypothetical protein
VGEDFSWATSKRHLLESWNFGTLARDGCRAADLLTSARFAEQNSRGPHSSSKSGQAASGYAVVEASTLKISAVRTKPCLGRFTCRFGGERTTGSASSHFGAGEQTHLDGFTCHPSGRRTNHGAIHQRSSGHKRITGSVSSHFGASEQTHLDGFTCHPFGGDERTTERFTSGLRATNESPGAQARTSVQANEPTWTGSPVTLSGATNEPRSDSPADFGRRKNHRERKLALRCK